MVDGDRGRACILLWETDKKYSISCVEDKVAPVGHHPGTKLTRDTGHKCYHPGSGDILTLSYSLRSAHCVSSSGLNHSLHQFARSREPVWEHWALFGKYLIKQRQKLDGFVFYVTRKGKGELWCHQLLSTLDESYASKEISLLSWFHRCSFPTCHVLLIWFVVPTGLRLRASWPIRRGAVLIRLHLWLDIFGQMKQARWNDTAICDHWQLFWVMYK